MKRLMCLMLLATAGLGGCTLDTPAYSAKERFAEIDRNIYWQQLQINDDIDDILLLRPSGQLTIWDNYHRD
jgi:hypothetical protein